MKELLFSNRLFYGEEGIAIISLVRSIQNMNSRNVQRQRPHFAWLLITFIGMIWMVNEASVATTHPVVAAIAKCGNNFVDVAIIGGGPAGLAAGRKIASLRRPAVIFTGDNPGGQLLGSVLVENIPGVPAQPGWQLIESEEKAVKSSGTVHIEYDVVVGLRAETVASKQLFFIETQNGECWCALSVIIATGGTSNLLGIPGEAERLNSSIFTCASCDGALAHGNVFVVGGGDASIDAVMTLLNHVPHCTLLVRKSYLRASPALQQRIADNPRITIRYSTEIVGIKGDGVTMSHLALKTPHGSEEVPADFLFLSIGHRPTTDYPWLRTLVVCDEHGYICVNGAQETSYRGIFAAGEVAMPLVEEHQVVYVYGTSTRAGKHALDYCDAWYVESPALKEQLSPYRYRVPMVETPQPSVVTASQA